MCPNSILNLFSFIFVTAFECVEGHYRGRNIGRHPLRHTHTHTQKNMVCMNFKV